eukprot:tig00020537_g10276.t1
MEGSDSWSEGEDVSRQRARLLGSKKRSGKRCSCGAPLPRGAAACENCAEDPDAEQHDDGPKLRIKAITSFPHLLRMRTSHADVWTEDAEYLLFRSALELASESLRTGEPVDKPILLMGDMVRARFSHIGTDVVRNRVKRKIAGRQLMPMFCRIQGSQKYNIDENIFASLRETFHSMPVPEGLGDAGGDGAPAEPGLYPAIKGEARGEGEGDEEAARVQREVAARRKVRARRPVSASAAEAPPASGPHGLPAFLAEAPPSPPARPRPSSAPAAVSFAIFPRLPAPGPGVGADHGAKRHRGHGTPPGGFGAAVGSSSPGHAEAWRSTPPSPYPLLSDAAIAATLSRAHARPGSGHPFARLFPAGGAGGAGSVACSETPSAASSRLTSACSSPRGPGFQALHPIHHALGARRPAPSGPSRAPRAPGRRPRRPRPRGPAAGAAAAEPPRRLQLRVAGRVPADALRGARLAGGPSPLASPGRLGRQESASAALAGLFEDELLFADAFDAPLGDPSAPSTLLLLLLCAAGGPRAAAAAAAGGARRAGVARGGGAAGGGAAGAGASPGAAPTLTVWTEAGDFLLGSPLALPPVEPPGGAEAAPLGEPPPPAEASFLPLPSPAAAPAAVGDFSVPSTPTTLPPPL